MARTAKRMPSSGGHTPKHGWPALIPYSPPWVAWLVLPAFAGMARHIWATSIPAAMAAAAGIVLLVVALTMFAWHAFRARGTSIRVHATMSVGAAGLWLVIALVAGLRSEIVWSIWGLGGFGVAFAWSMRRLARSDGTDNHDDEGGQKILDAVGLAGARFGKPQVQGPKVKATLHLVPGEHTTGDAQNSLVRLSSRLGLRKGAVRVLPTENESKPRIEIVPNDPLVKAIAWRGPNAPGQSIAEPVEFGTYEDSDRMQLWFPGDPKKGRVSAHFGAAGMTGAGKTETGLVICTNVITRTDASLIYIDPVKGIQSVAPIIDGVDLPILDKPGGMKALKRLPYVISERTNWLGQHGFKQWESGCGLKYLIYWIEESAALIADSTSFVKIVEQARSAGISIVVSQQRMSHDRMDTSVRENLGGALCFGVKSQVSAEMVLSEETVDAGAAPWVWKNNKPGYLYLEAPGIDPDRFPIPGRGDLAEMGHIRAVVAEFARPGLDDVTASAIGEQYRDHLALIGSGAAPWQAKPKTATKMPARVTPPPAGPVDAYDDDLPDDYPDDDDDDDEEYDMPANPEPGFMDTIDPTQDIPDDDDEIVPIGVPVAAELTRSVAVAHLRAELERWVAAGQETISPRDLMDVRVAVGRSASWLSGELRKLVDEGFLTEEPDRGVYGLPHRVPA